MNTHKKTWFETARWGVFSHFLANAPGQDVAGGMNTGAWNRKVDGFDVDGLAQQLEEVKAGYYTITIGQRAGYCCSPNKAFEDIVGPELNWFSNRDLIADLAGALASKGIRLMVYLAALPPRRKTVRREILL